MKVGDLIRVRHHSTNKNGLVGIYIKMVRKPRFRVEHCIRLSDKGQGLCFLTREQCEVLSESR